MSLPHLAGTFVRFLIVRTRIDQDVLLGFGAASALGGLVGAALQTMVRARLSAPSSVCLGSSQGSEASPASRNETLRRMSEAVFRRVVGVLLLVLGTYALARAFS